MADRDQTTHTTSTGTRTTAPGDRPLSSDYRDPRTTTTTTSTKRRGTSWIGVLIAVLAIAVIAAWWAGGFDGTDETAMLVGESVVEGEVIGEGIVEGEVLDEGAVPAGEVIEETTTTVPLETEPAAEPATEPQPTTTEKQ